VIESPGWRLSATPGLSLEVAGAEIRRLKSESTKHDAPRRAAQLMSGHEIAHLGPEDGAPDRDRFDARPARVLADPS
jgi:hypothetical protein